MWRDAIFEEILAEKSIKVKKISSFKTINQFSAGEFKVSHILYASQ